MAEAGTSECENQKTIISNLLKSSLKKDDTWYLVDTKWFKQWKKYVGWDHWDTSSIGEKSANPGPIDNSGLFKEGSNEFLKEGLIDELEYALIPKEGWKKLFEWYGLVDGQKPVARKVIEQGMFVKHCKVEVYQLELKLAMYNDPDAENITMRQFSRCETIDYIIDEMKPMFKIKEDKPCRLWNKYMSNTYEELDKTESTLQDVGLYQHQLLVIEPQNEDGTWPRDGPKKVETESTYSSHKRSGGSGETNTGSGGWNSNSSGASGSNYYGSSNNDDSYSKRAASPTTPGLCGLSNLGNTCFMNSAIQCMSNVPELTEYFLTQDYYADLNLDNPLGMQGEIATSYAELIKNMWSGSNSYTVPRNFKVAVGRFAPQFSGYQQQDSQELMAFLLDGLHEDLNRIKKKPYVEQKDGDGRPDDIVAKEAWDTYKLRNDSVIVDTFHGQLKSTLVCPQCDKVSITFDPFCYLSLPLPDKKERFIEVIFVPHDPMKKPKHYKLTVPQHGNVHDLKKAFAKINKLSLEFMIVADVYNRRFHKEFEEEEPLTSILDRDDIFIYEIPVKRHDNDTAVIPVYMREKKVSNGYTGGPKVSQQLFGQPLFVTVPRNTCTYSILYNNVLEKMKRYVKLPDDNDEWWRKPVSANNSSSKKTANKGAEMDCEEDGDEAVPTATKPQTSPSSSSTASSTSSVEKMESGSNGNARVENETEGTTEDNIEEEVDEAGNPPRLFTFMMVNSYGTTEMDKMPPDDGKVFIKFSNRSYLATDWHTRAKELFYDEKASEELEVDESVNNRNNSSGPGGFRQGLQLTECLDLFTTTEKLGENDPWYCPDCKKHMRATKKFDLWKLPPVLVIHLKRFSYNRSWRDKLDTFVEFPTKGLDLEKWVIGDPDNHANYDLVSVCNHYGGMGNGHYTAYAKNKTDNNWYYFDDSSVSCSNEESSVTKAGYVLVYRRSDKAVPDSTTTADGAASSSVVDSSSINNQNNSAATADTPSKSSRASPPSATISSPTAAAGARRHITPTSVSNATGNSDDEEMDVN